MCSLTCNIVMQIRLYELQEQLHVSSHIIVKYWRLAVLTLHMQWHVMQDQILA